MADTPKLGAPYLATNTDQKEVLHNTALDIYDALVQLTLKDRDLTSPPGSPTLGDTYIVGGSATGSWSGHDDDVVEWVSAQWEFHTPQEGWFGYLQDEKLFIFWDGSAWATFPGSAIVDAKADSSTKGLATFSATEFADNGAGLLSLARIFTRSQALTDASTDLFEIALPSGAMTGGKILVTIVASDGTNHQVLCQEVTWAAVNKAGSYTANLLIVPSAEQDALSSGTLTATWGITSGTNKVTISVTPTGSLAETTYSADYTILNNSPQAITFL